MNAKRHLHSSPSPVGLQADPVPWPPLTQAGRDRLRERAIAEAPALRTQAIADFWRDADTLLGQAIDSGRRAADRLAARLRQHTKQRRAAAAAGK